MYSIYVFNSIDFAHMMCTRLIRTHHHIYIYRSIFLAAVVILAIALGITLGGSNNNESASSNATGDVVETPSTIPNATTSNINDEPTLEVDGTPPISPNFQVEYLESVGPIPSRVRMANPTVANGYNSCMDMKDDILNALKYHFNSIIVSESENLGLPDSW